MLNAEISQVPREGASKLSSVVRLDLLDRKGQHLSDLIDKVHGILLDVLVVEAENPEPRAVVNGGEDVALHSVPVEDHGV